MQLRDQPRRSKKIDRIMRYYFRYLVQMPSQYKYGNLPHIFIFSSRRSGSTVLRDMIASQAGFNYIDEPFNFSSTQYHPHLNYFGNRRFSQVTSITNMDEHLLLTYLDNLLSRKFITRSNWRIFDRNYHWRFNRYVVKELNAKNLIPWFQKQYSDRIKIIFHIRNPIAVGLSVLRTKWPHYYLEFYQDKLFNETYLNSKTRHLIESLDIYGTEIEKYILDWCLENLIPLELVSKKQLPIISYEQIATDPVESSNFLAKIFDLEDPNEMARVSTLPSPTAKGGSVREVSNKGSRSRINAWRSEMPQRELAKSLNIIDTFELKMNYIY